MDHRRYRPRDSSFIGVVRTLLAAGPLCCASLLTGCQATIHESHYFAAHRLNDRGKREPVQFYRVKVDGHTEFSDTRYLTGYFDERALSLFFNEIKAPPGQKLFDETVKLPGADPETKLVPLTPGPENGAFVMIMSTNADAVASAIGSFAESQVVADAFTQILNRDKVTAKLASDAQLPVVKAEGDALNSVLRTHATAAAGAVRGDAAATSYLRALNAIARALGHQGGDFRSTQEARQWFALESSRAGSSR